MPDGKQRPDGWQPQHSSTAKHLVKVWAAILPIPTKETPMPDTNSSNEPHNLSVAGAAALIRDGSLSAVDYVSALLRRCRGRADLNAFIRLDEESILEAARASDLHRKSNKPMGPLHGVPIAIKDSMQIRGIPTSAGTKVLADFRPEHDAAVIPPILDAGAILFGKNNLAEMSFGYTGLNVHYGQVRNPYNVERITGGSSSGAGASIAARLVPAAFGGDTVGSIRIPASLCGIVGFRPTTGRWPSRGAAPISHTFDTIGPLARTVEDCALLDAVVTGKHVAATSGPGMKGVRIGYAPKQFLDLVDPDVERAFMSSIEKLKEAGAEVIEIDLGDDFIALVEKANWPIFWHQVMPHVTDYLRENNAPATFEEVYEGLGDNVKPWWTAGVLPSGSDYVPEEACLESLNVHRPLLQKRYADSYGSNDINALIFPTTPVVAPPIGSEKEITVAGRTVDILTISKNVLPSSCAGLPGISLPIGLSTDGMPIGMEIDGKAGEDHKLLNLATRISAVIGSIPDPLE
jgi:indoleacetamide hydrolase